MPYLFVRTDIEVEEVHSKMNFDRVIWFDQFVIAQKK
jgi:hypothetical protein